MTGRITASTRLFTDIYLSGRPVTYGDAIKFARGGAISGWRVRKSWENGYRLMTIESPFGNAQLTEDEHNSILVELRLLGKI